MIDIEFAIGRGKTGSRPTSGSSAHNGVKSGSGRGCACDWDAAAKMGLISWKGRRASAVLVPRAFLVNAASLEMLYVFVCTQFRTRRSLKLLLIFLWRGMFGNARFQA